MYLFIFILRIYVEFVFFVVFSFSFFYISRKILFLFWLRISFKKILRLVWKTLSRKDLVFKLSIVTHLSFLGVDPTTS